MALHEPWQRKRHGIALFMAVRKPWLVHEPLHYTGRCSARAIAQQRFLGSRITEIVVFQSFPQVLFPGKIKQVARKCQFLPQFLKPPDLINLKFGGFCF
jgi:hypothetical protein